LFRRCRRSTSRCLKSSRGIVKGKGRREKGETSLCFSLLLFPSFSLLPSPLTPRTHYTISLPRGRTLQLRERTLVMGILNITPDSFADGGVRFEPARAIEDGFRMIAEGADILDVGGESTRPGAEPLDAAEELRRVLPVVEALAADPRVPVSIDTYKAAVAREALARGAAIVNDVSALQYDDQLAHTVAEAGAALVLMHSRGRSRDMYREAVYQDVAAEVRRELETALRRATAAGVPREAIILDPGLGFAKRAEHSYEALASLASLAALDRPILAGPSRKSFLKAGVGDVPPAGREWGTAAAVTASVLFGAHIVRVHGVKEMRQVVDVADKIRAAWFKREGETFDRRKGEGETPSLDQKHK
jgi:dihydropteroate synthase